MTSTITRTTLLRRAAIAGAGTLVAACGGPAASGTPSSGMAKEPVRLQMFNQSGMQKDVDDWTLMLAPFMQKYPNVTFDVGGAPSGPNGLLDKALAMGAAGTPPDFTYSVTRNGPTLFTSGLTQDMNTLVKREKIDLKDVAKGALENFEWKGALMALPYDPGYAFIQYNKTLFDKAGVPDPGTLWRQKKWDWDAFTNTITSFARAVPADSQRAAFFIRTWAEHVKNLGIPQNDPKSWLAVYQELTSLVQGVPWTVNYVEWHTIFQNEVLKPVGNGEKSPQEAVSAKAPKIAAILQRK